MRYAILLYNNAIKVHMQVNLPEIFLVSFNLIFLKKNAKSNKGNPAYTKYTYT